MNKEFKNAILSAALVGVLGASVETITSAQTPEIPGHLNPGTALAERGKENNPMHRLKAESSKLKTPAEMVEQSLKVENPMHVHRAMPENPMVVTDTVGDKRVKLSFGAAGLPEVASRLRKAIEGRGATPLTNPEKQSNGLDTARSNGSVLVPNKDPRAEKKDKPWSLTMGTEVANKNFGEGVGATINEEPASRFYVTLIRSLTKKWKLALKFWQSIGPGSNLETDLGVAFIYGNKDKQISAGLTRSLVRGVDISQINVGGSFTFRGLGMGPSYSHYSGAPGGDVFRFDFTLPATKLPKGLRFGQTFSLGTDNNPFKLNNPFKPGKDWTGMGFYNFGVTWPRGKGECYIKTGVSAPLTGRGNTTRERQSAGFVVGCSRTTNK